MDSKNENRETQDHGDIENWEAAKAATAAFVQERDWEQFHALKELIIGLNVEAGELLEHTLWAERGAFEDEAIHEGEKRKVYRGMASPEAQFSWRGRASSLEGISSTVPYKGSVELILTNLVQGLRSGMSYSGARTLKELQHRAQFIKQTSAGATESGTHILTNR